jgi:tetratricopeptide (TPR) repeat protein
MAFLNCGFQNSRSGCTMKIKYAGFVSISCVLLLSGCATQSSDAYFRERHIRDINSEDNVIMSMREALKKSPNNADYLFNLGRAYYATGLYDDAVTPLEKARNIQPQAPDIHLALGGVYFGLERYEDAKNEFEEALNIDPKNINGNIGLAKVYRRRTNNEKYLEQVDIIRKVDSKEADYLSRVLEKENEPEKILDPEMSEELTKKASSSIESGEYLKAIDEGNLAIKNNPKNAWAYYDIGLALRRLGLYHKALAFYKKSVLLDSDLVNAYVNMGLIYMGLERTEEAISMWQKAISISPATPEAYANLGAAYMEIGKSNEARGNLNKALELFSSQRNQKEEERVSKLLSKLK